MQVPCPQAFPRAFTTALVIVLSVVSAAVAEDWPQWRGPNCTGLSTSKLSLPVHFSPTDHVRWSVELGEGVCSPTIATGRVFSTAILGDQDEERRFSVFCFDASSGKRIWERTMPVGKKPLLPIHESSSYASATPAADADRVYAYFTRLGLLAFDARTGKTVWELPLPEPYFIFDWGPGMSPVLYGDNLYFCQDDDLSPALYAIDKKSGKVIWKDDRSDMAVCYSHPVICDTPAGPELVVAGTGNVIGYDLANGKRKWAAELFCRNIKTTPISLGGVLYVAVESQGISYQWRATADADGDGKITREEIRASRIDKGADIPEAFWIKFERGDVNKDGVLEGEEIDLAFLDPSNQGGLLAREVDARAKGEKDWKKFDDELQTESSVQAIRGGGRGDVSKTHVLWKKVSRAPDGLISPLVIDGRILFIKADGITNCLDATCGEPLWSKKRIPDLGRCLGSPVAGDGKIYAASQTGRVVVLENGPTLNILASNDMGENIVGTPGIADGRLYIRTRTKLYCIE
jgi:outer membrane protein assembly factor BamB